jgi:ubiquinone/menaquinone biosynthesis C-methylase UbiE
MASLIDPPMNDSQAIPFWGPEQLELLHLMTQAVDPEGQIPAAMQTTAPIEGRVVLDVGAGVGDRTILYARLASHVYALEPDPAAIPLLRGRAKSSGATNITVLPAGAERIPLENDIVDVAYATWSYFFGPGSEPGLREVERVVRPGGDVVVAQNYGHDDLSQIWTPDEAECETWPVWFARHGFEYEVVDTVWRFHSVENARAVLGYLWGTRAGAHVIEHQQVEYSYRVAIYHRQVPELAEDRAE